MIRLIAVAAFALAVATSAQAMSLLSEALIFGCVGSALFGGWHDRSLA